MGEGNSFSLLVCLQGGGVPTLTRSKVPTPQPRYLLPWPGQDWGEGVPQGTYPSRQGTYPLAKSGRGEGLPHDLLDLVCLKLLQATLSTNEKVTYKRPNFYLTNFFLKTFYRDWH